MTIEQFRKHFASDSGVIHFNNAGQAPIPDVNLEAAVQWLQRFHREGASCSMEGWGQVEKARQRLAAFLGAHSEELALVQTTASAISQAALGIPLQPGDEILTWDQEYPSNFYPWRVAAERSGAHLIQVKSDGWLTPVSRLLDRVTSKTKVIAISWVQYQTGSVTDLKALSTSLKNRGIWLVADVIQGAGVRPFHFHDSGFDLICGGAHKWLCSGYGVGFMAVRKEKIDQLRLLEFGAMTYGNPDTPKSFTIEPKPTAARFEPGSKSMIEVIAMTKTLDLFEAAGMEAISAEASRLGRRLRQGLEQIGFEHACAEGPIVNFSSRDDKAVAELLKSAKISHALRGPGVRISLHAFNSETEVDQTLDLLKAHRP